ncbi:unnamed protein product [Polarella glacialis]|uniref:Uncharacterized protein n=1 Tax=Polarella glacialis TaxID=89957 RepID=A0A813H2Y6_POLGL|nr:unnamed protein product [Polarella glacialis]
MKGPLLPEPTSSPSSGCRYRQGGPAASGTCRTPKVEKEPASKLDIKLLLGSNLQAKGQTGGSDCSTTAPTSWCEDYESDCNDEAMAARAGIPLQMSKEVGGPVQNIIIFDWDDTLMPTGFLRDLVCMYGVPSPQGRSRTLRMPGAGRAGRISRGSIRTPQGFPCQAALESHVELIREALCAARSMAHVAIVTMAERPWVLESAEKYLPSLCLSQLLQDLNIPVYYASEYRPCGSERAPDQLQAACKRLAMEDFLHGLGAGFGRNTRLNLLSVGDSMAEREAARTVRTNSAVPVCKTIKLVSDPSLKMLSFELRSLLVRLQHIVAIDQGLDLIFKSSDTMGDIEAKLKTTFGS